MSRGDTPFWKTFLLEMATKSPTFKQILLELEIISNPEDTVISRNSEDEKEEASTKVVVVDVNEGKKRKSEDDEEQYPNKRKKKETEDDSDDQTVEEDSLPLKIPKTTDVSKQDGWMNKVYSSTDDNITSSTTKIRKRGEFSKEEVIFNY
jgi:hypothetical protein